MVDALKEDDPLEVSGHRLIGRLGSGASGVVYLGEDANGQRVAIKVLHREIAASPEVRRRLRNEAEALRRVRSDRVAQVRSVVTDGPTPHLVMELVGGETLEQLVGRSPLTGPMVAAVAEGLVEALQAIHAAGVVHRDLKPSNVLFGQDGVRVVDFGVSAFDETAGTTRTGALVGTPSWISPEQATGEQVGPAADVFLLGMVVAYAASGEHPFGVGRADAMLFRIVHEEPDIRRVPSSLRKLIGNCLEKDADRRPSLDQLAAALRGIDSAQLDHELPADRTYAASSTRLGVAATEEAHGALTAGRTRRRRRATVVLAIVGPILVGSLAAYRFVDATGDVVVEYSNVTSRNPQLRSPQLIIRGPEGRSDIIDLPAQSVGRQSYRSEVGWRLSNELEIEYLPSFEDSEHFSTILNPRRNGMWVLSRGRDVIVRIDVRDAETSASVIIPRLAGFEFAQQEYLALDLARKDEQRAIREARAAASRARTECGVELGRDWRSMIRPALELERKYRDYRQQYGLNDGGTITSARYRNQIINLVDAMSTEYAVLSLIDPPPSADVVDDLLELFDSYGVLIRAWTDYEIALLFPRDRGGLYSDLYPVEHAAMERAEEAFSQAADSLPRTLDREVRAACERRHPDPR